MTATRSVAVFFYGLFMDAELLRRRGIAVNTWSRARLEGYRLVLGARATLVPEPGCTTHGVLMELEGADVARLYAEPGVRAYRPETVKVVLENSETTDAQCYTLPQPLPVSRPDRAYALQLHALAARLGLPEPYLATIEQAAATDS